MLLRKEKKNYFVFTQSRCSNLPMSVRTIRVNLSFRQLPVDSHAPIKEMSPQLFRIRRLCEDVLHSIINQNNGRKRNCLARDC